MNKESIQKMYDKVNESIEKVEEVAQSLTTIREEIQNSLPDITPAFQVRYKGDIISEQTAIGTYMRVLIDIGLKRICDRKFTAGVGKNTILVVTTEKDGRNREAVDGYHIYKAMDNHTKARVLERIADKLKLDLKVL